MFSIRVLPSSETGGDGQRLGEIAVDDFREEFSCYPSDQPVDEMEFRWKEVLRKLLEGEHVAVLKHDPCFAWIIYREGERCYVQQRMSLDQTFDDLLPRAMGPPEGGTVSQWETNLSAIKMFIES